MDVGFLFQGAITDFSRHVRSYEFTRQLASHGLRYLMGDKTRNRHLLQAFSANFILCVSCHRHQWELLLLQGFTSIKCSSKFSSSRTVLKTEPLHYWQGSMTEKRLAHCASFVSIGPKTTAWWSPLLNLEHDQCSLSDSSIVPCCLKPFSKECNQCLNCQLQLGFEAFQHCAFAS